MKLNMLIPTLAFAGILLDVVSHLFRTKNMLKKLGVCQVLFSRKTQFTWFIIFGGAHLLIALLYIREFRPVFAAMLASTGVMAVELVLRDIVFRLNSGLYENGVITEGKLLFKSELLSVAEPSAEDARQKAGEPCALDIAKKDASRDRLFFQNAAERDQALEVMKGWK